MKGNYLYSDITKKIIGCTFKVYNSLGYGFLEKVYENSLKIELEHMGLEVKQQYPIKVCYRDLVVGEYFADLFIEDKIIVELKVAKEVNKIHEIQLVNYLKATGIRVGLLIYFTDRVIVKRKIV